MYFDTEDTEVSQRIDTGRHREEHKGAASNNVQYNSASDAFVSHVILFRSLPVTCSTNNYCVTGIV